MCVCVCVCVLEGAMAYRIEIGMSACGDCICRFPGRVPHHAFPGLQDFFLSLIHDEKQIQSSLGILLWALFPATAMILRLTSS